MLESIIRNIKKRNSNIITLIRIIKYRIVTFKNKVYYDGQTFGDKNEAFYV